MLLKFFALSFISANVIVISVSGQSEDDSILERELEQRSPELIKISNSQLKFSTKLYKILNDLDKRNFIYSPLILHLALSSLRLAADGDTLGEINDAAGISKLNNSYVLNGYENLIDMIKSDENATVKFVNRLFTSKQFKIDGNYARVLREKFSGDITPVDFSNITMAAQTINFYISNYTNGTIQNFIGEESLEPSNKVVMLNSLYFKAEWEREFTPLMTTKQPFITENGTEIEVDMMNRGGFYQCAEIIELNSTALSIPFKGGRYSLTIILPEQGIPISQLEKNLESYPMHAVLSKMTSRYVQLSLPRFSLESNIDMMGLLESLGIRTVFSPYANLTKMSRKHGLYVNSVVQRAFLTVAEGGSEVAASNFIEAVPATPRFLVPFSVDRPFVTFLHDKRTDSILLVGKKLH